MIGQSQARARLSESGDVEGLFAAIRRLDAKTVAAVLLADCGRTITSSIATRALWTVLGMENLFEGDAFPAKSRIPRVDQIVDSLLETGADVNACCGSYRALHFAACMVPYNIKRLIEAGAEVNAQTGSGWTALMGAPTSSAKLLLEAGADPNISTVYGWTAMHLCRSTSKAALLFEYGASLDARDAQGQTPIMHAAKVGCVPMLKWLSHNEELLGARDDNGNNALLLAVKAGKKKTAKLLLERGISAYSENDQGETASTAAESSEEMMELFSSFISS